MNSSKHGRGSLHRVTSGPIYSIEYVKGARTLRDSARSLEGAWARIEARLAKPRNRGKIARVWHGGQVILTHQK